MRKAPVQLLLFVCLALPILIGLSACAGEGGDLIGTWIDEAGVVQLQFKADGSLLVDYPGSRFTATYTTQDGRLSVEARGPNGKVLGAMFQNIEYQVDTDRLILTNPEGDAQTLHRK